mmetsp:Transcript_47818/g.88996  ORF Transcript_47818/g.88996 Transcript_47818/m.88996 type:complete len:84 (+) Transcript_47818:129-380(+)
MRPPILSDRTKVLVGSGILVWAAALQGHMWWMQDQPEFKKKFGSENLEAGQANGPTSSNGWGFFSFKWKGLDAKPKPPTGSSE